MRNLIGSVLTLAMSAGSALATVECNQHGAVVTVENGTTYYFGKSCDAAKQGGGEGRWWLSASALVVEIDGIIEDRIEFDVDCNLPACWLN